MKILQNPSAVFGNEYRNCIKFGYFQKPIAENVFRNYDKYILVNNQGQDIVLTGFIWISGNGLFCDVMLQQA